MRFWIGATGIVLCCVACVTASAQANGQGSGYAPGRLERLDANHDGKLTRDEINRALAGQFSAATHGARLMSLDQFVATRTGDAKARVAQVFHRFDWNGDGKLTFDEYAGPQRARFEAMDRDGKGAESCAPDAVQSAAYRPGVSRKSSFGRVRFCAENDLNHDGMVTHAEFDGVTAKHFSSSTSGAKAMTETQFVADTLARYRETDARIYGYLDRDHDGKLSLAEFAASDQKLFARLDKNSDGVLIREEMSFTRYSNASFRQN